MKTFFITGLPRSRTAWLANLFTYGNSFCYHDFVKCGRLPRMDGMDRINGASYMGDSDSGLVHMVDLAHKLYPQARWLFVRRDKDQAMESFEYYFLDNPYPGVPRGADLRTAFAQCEANFYHAKSVIPPEFRTEIDFHSLEDAAAVRHIWEWLTPENPWSQPRYEMLQQMRVNIIPQKVEVTLWQ